jgi:hypothetical protein
MFEFSRKWSVRSIASVFQKMTGDDYEKPWKDTYKFDFVKKSEKGKA